MNTIRTAFLALVLASATGCLFDPTYCWESDKSKCCSDKKLTNDETDVDCGGTFCGACDDLKACVEAKDCQSGVCTSGACAPPTCTDQVKNGQESDKDCGGSCSKCPNESACNTGADCQNKSCKSGVCKAPACDDDVQNGSETDKDCGGSCDPCGAGGACEEDSANCTSDTFCSLDSICTERLSCSGMVECVGGCTDRDCIGACSEAGTDTATPLFNALLQCIYTKCLAACSGTNQAACQSCTTSNCSAETAACQAD